MESQTDTLDLCRKQQPRMYVSVFEPREGYLQGMSCHKLPIQYISFLQKQLFSFI